MMLRWVVLLAAVLVVSACGGKKRVDTAKLATLQKVALVGVCGTDDAGWFDGNSPKGRSAGFGAALLPHVAAGLDEALGPALGGIALVPHATVSATTALVFNPNPGRNFACAAWSKSPYRTSGMSGNPKPDLALMKALAQQLGVDAVVSVTVNPVYHFGNSAVQVRARGMNPVNAFVVDKDGQLILQAQLVEVLSDKFGGFDVQHSYTWTSASIAPEDQKGLGVTFGRALALKLAEAMRAQ